MKKNIFKIGLIICSIIFTLYLCNTISNAASSNASISKTTVTVGDTFTVTIKADNAAGTYSVSTNNSNATLTSGSTSEFLENSSATLTYKAVTAGTITITAKTEMTDLDNSSNDVSTSKSFTVTINAASTGGNNNTGNGNTGNTSGNNTGSSSSGNSSSSTTTTPAAPNFKDASKTVYTAKDSVNLRSSWSTSSSATTVPKGTELRLTGTSTEKVNGYVWYRVTFNGQIKYVNKDLITETKPEEEKEPEKSANVNLKTLSIEGVELTPVFSNDVTEYSAVLSNFEGKDLKVTAEAEDEKTTVSIEGNKNIKDGENVIMITVKAEDGTTKITTITVTKEETKAFGLQSLSINGKPIENFETDKLKYKISFTNSEKLEIEAVANEEGATVEIKGNENLVNGENEITIIVTSKDGERTVTYTIKANKLLVAEQKENKSLNLDNLLVCIIIVLITLILIVILALRYLKHNEKMNTIDNEYSDRFDEKEEYTGYMNKKDDTEFAEDMQEIDDDTPRKRGKGGKHSI